MKKSLIAIGAVVALGLGVVVTATSPGMGCGAKCCKRPSGAKVEACMRVNPNTNITEDFGENTMPGSLAIGAGCAPTECVSGVGIEPVSP